MEAILNTILNVLSSSSMALFSVGFHVVGFIVNLILTPLNALVSQFVNLNTYVIFVNLFWYQFVSYANWFLSFTGISQDYFTLLVNCWIYILSVPMMAYGIKLVVKWYHTLKG